MNVMIYPYTILNQYIKTHKELFLYEITHYLVAGQIIDQEANDAGKEICTYQDLLSDPRILEAVDAFCIIDEVPDPDELYKITEYLCSKGKNIICALDEHTAKIKELCEKHQVELLSGDTAEKYPAKRSWVNSYSILDIDVPIITVFGMGLNVQKFDLQLYLRKRFVEKGYKVSQIGTKPISTLFGFHSIPKFMYNKEFTDVEKVMAFNRFVKKIEKEEKPDVIILGIPEPVIPLNSKHRFSFGLYAYEILNAVKSDFAIASLYGNSDYDENFYSEMSEMSKYKLNVEIDAFYISQFFPISNSLWTDHLVFGYVPETDIIENSYSVYSMEDLVANTLFDQAEKKLLLYGKFEQF